MTKREFLWFVTGILAIGIFIGVCIACTVYLNNAQAEDELVYPCWIFCTPGDDVMIREKPGKRSSVVGSAESCKQMWTDWQEKNGWIHLVDVNNETGEGWVSEAYIVFEEPALADCDMRVSGCRRVACRSGINGDRKKWAKSGAVVHVYLIADEWAVTNKGFIQSQYLEECK